ncbi:FKBP-type peptidyl-prolyl cis-trans isomerase [Marinilabilia salmonicolor]|jgi:FKBP-type peptidyl-prolyl cis-trans isomerase|uniref:Peptidyl-prolyl cis-trans isomerase n=1 Tax=Marinilabilia salmonicolor TaxID=989 RepID=A0A2T0XFQ9_9BACT|nr:FKBP-type peptidyl-prolyl cis-trans isomerase [Marinilabilia salmonicolor]PRY97783.1 FKBP-type peptidyl-prolyl cis-trans isomerase [Marinilabilia salmonicolor]RCW32482.1 FKBP-type peptidyl-prolyl cis-trans isomerase [Marinilabilia salmonicolor]
MKGKQLIPGLIAVILVFSACNKVPNTGKANMETQLDSLSYALGFYEASEWKKKFEQTPFDTIDYKKVALAFKNSELVESYLNFRKGQFDTIDIDMFKKGFFNEIAYDKSYYTEITADIYIRKIFQQVKDKNDSLRQIEAQKNLEKGEAFLEENAKKENVIVLESGLQYKVIEEGDGKSPSINDRVKCLYHGTLIDGTVFDSTVERGDTAQFGVNQVIKGWQEALPMMKEGGKWQLFVPADLAYGNTERGEFIKANETLIFDIELIEVIERKQNTNKRR